MDLLLDGPLRWDRAVPPTWLFSENHDTEY
jgi:hypothetical protein